MGEVVSNIRTELLEMLRGVQLRSDQANLQDVGEPVGVIILSTISRLSRQPGSSFVIEYLILCIRVV